MENFIEIGYISGVFGINGQVKATLDVHDINEYRRQKSVYMGKKPQAPALFQLKKFDIKGDSFAILTIDGVNDRTFAEGMVGYTLYITEEQLPTLAPGKFYYFQVIGFDIEDKQRGTLGKIKDIIEMPAQDLIAMEYMGKEVLIPMVEHFVGDADFEKKCVFTDLPEGLIEMYLSDKETEEDEG